MGVAKMALSSTRLESEPHQTTMFRHHAVAVADQRLGAASIVEMLIAFTACGALACAGAVAGFLLVCSFACEGPLLIAGSAFGAVGGVLAGVALFRPLRVLVSE